MAIKFLTEEWIKALMEEVNKSREYREAARSWEGDFYFIMETEGSETTPDELVKTGERIFNAKRLGKPPFRSHAGPGQAPVPAAEAAARRAHGGPCA